MEATSTTESIETQEKDIQNEQIKEFVLPSRPIMILLVGLIGSGKSTFAKAVARHYPKFMRCNQDDLGDRRRVERLVIKSLSEGRSVIVDRTNIDSRQRKIWLDIVRTGFSRVPVWVVTMDTPYEVCAERLKTRTDHPTIKTWSVAKTVLNRFASEYEEPSIMEDFDRMYELKPHPTGDWTKQDISKILSEIDSSPSTRLEAQGTSTLSDLSLYVGVPLAVAAGAIGIAHHFLSKPRAA